METIAKEIMSTEVLTATREMTLEDAAKLLVNSRITGFPVVDSKGKMIGVFSEYDLLAQVGTQRPLKPDVFQQKIKFSKETKAIQETMPLDQIIDLFIKSKFRRLPVVNKTGRLVGIITRRDLMRLFYYRAKLA